MALVYDENGVLVPGQTYWTERNNFGITIRREAGGNIRVNTGHGIQAASQVGAAQDFYELAAVFLEIGKYLENGI